MTNLVVRGVLSVFGVPTAEPGQVPAVSGRIAVEQVRESSGLARSGKVAGRFWTHNDSGSAAELFAIGADGAGLSGPVRVEGAKNVDWEDVAADGEGRLWIADLGNNLNRRKDLRIYVVREPGEEIPATLPLLRTLRVRFPEQTEFPPEALNFDCEALFVYGGRPYVLSKRRGDTGTRLYRLDDNRTEEEQVLTVVGEASGTGQVTAAALHPDGRRLAVLTYAGVWLFEREGEGDNFLARVLGRREVPRWGLGQSEGIAWIDGETLLVSNEQRDLFRIPLAEFTEGAAAGAPAFPESPGGGGGAP